MSMGMDDIPDENSLFLCFISMFINRSLAQCIQFAASLTVNGKNIEIRQSTCKKKIEQQPLKNSHT